MKGKKDKALLRVDNLLAELRDKYNIQSLCVLAAQPDSNGDKLGEYCTHIYGKDEVAILHCAQTAINGLTESIKAR